MSSPTSPIRSSLSSNAFFFPSLDLPAVSSDQGPPELEKTTETGGAWELFIGELQLEAASRLSPPRPISSEVKTPISFSPEQRYTQLVKECAQQLCGSSSTSDHVFDAIDVLSRLADNEMADCMGKLHSLLPPCDPSVAYKEVPWRIRLFEAISQIPLVSDPNDCIEKTRWIVTHDQADFFSAEMVYKLFKRFARMDLSSRHRVFEYLQSSLEASQHQLTFADIGRRFDRSSELEQRGSRPNLTGEERIALEKLIHLSWKAEEIEALYDEIATLPPLERGSIMEQAMLLHGSSFLVGDTITALQTLHGVKQDVRDRSMACLAQINVSHWTPQNRIQLFQSMVQWEDSDLGDCITALSAIMDNTGCSLDQAEDVLSMLEEILRIRTKNEVLDRVRCLRDLKSIIERTSFHWMGKEVVQVFKRIGFIETEVCKLIVVPRKAALGNDCIENHDHDGAHVRLLLLAMELGGSGAEWCVEKIDKFLYSISDHSEPVLAQKGSKLMRRLYAVKDWRASDTVQLFHETVFHVDDGKLFLQIHKLLKEFDKIVASTNGSKEDLIKKLGAQLTKC